MVLREEVDTISDPKKTHRRGRIEMPTLDFPNLRLMRADTDFNTKSRCIQQTVKQLVKEFYSACNAEFNLSEDAAFHPSMRQKTPDNAMLLNNLYWRCREQSGVLDTFWRLQDQGLLRSDSLEAPINWYTSSTNLSQVAYILKHFEAFQKPEDDPFPGYQHRSFALSWLAIMIVRSYTNKLDKLVEILQGCGYLGFFNWEGFYAHKAKKIVLT